MLMYNICNLRTSIRSENSQEEAYSRETSAIRFRFLLAIGERKEEAVSTTCNTIACGVALDGDSTLHRLLRLGATHGIKRCGVQGRLGALAHGALFPAVDGGDDPFADLAVDEVALVLDGLRFEWWCLAISFCFRGSFCGFFVFLFDGFGFVEGREPGVLEEHGIGRSKFGDLV